MCNCSVADLYNVLSYVSCLGFGFLYILFPPHLHHLFAVVRSPPSVLLLCVELLFCSFALSLRSRFSTLIPLQLPASPPPSSVFSFTSTSRFSTPFPPELLVRLSIPCLLELVCQIAALYAVRATSDGSHCGLLSADAHVFAAGQQ